MFAAVILAAGSVSPVPAGPNRLAGSEWRPLEIAGETVPGSAGIFVRFEAKGRMAGSGGCNRIFGSFENDDATVRMGPAASTRRACPPDIMKREQAFLDALTSARLYLRNQARLTLKDARGTTVLRLVQSDWD